MSEMGWREAIIEVLKGSSVPMHYVEIADTIAARELRAKVGATPPTTVNAMISASINNEGENSPFVRVEKGRYWLRGVMQTHVQAAAAGSQSDIENVVTDGVETTGLINALGMYWARNLVLWASVPRILGRLQAGSDPVDFCDQKGVYLLHDGRSVVYVGRTTDQPLGVRLRQHTIDRLNGRWDRFSWFGIYPAVDSGSLNYAVKQQFDLSMLIVTMEALLIEGLEPPQNRKRGDDFRAVEFLQAQDPELEKREILELIDSLKQRL